MANIWPKSPVPMAKMFCKQAAGHGKNPNSNQNQLEPSSNRLQTYTALSFAHSLAVSLCVGQQFHLKQLRACFGP